MFKQPSARRQRGAAMVEFALVVPIFLALVFGIISYGYMLSFRQAISQAASEGARAYAVAPPGLSAADRDARVRAAVNDALSGYGITCSGTSLVRGGTSVGTCPAPSLSACESGQCVSVTVDHAYRDHPLVPSFPGLGIALPDDLTYTAVMGIS